MSDLYNDGRSTTTGSIDANYETTGKTEKENSLIFLVLVMTSQKDPSTHTLKGHLVIGGCTVLVGEWAVFHFPQSVIHDISDAFI